MEYTKNYHLPQWAEEDRVMRTDFNTMCENSGRRRDGEGADLGRAAAGRAAGDGGKNAPV